MDTYATIKSLTQGNVSFPIGLLINQCPDRRTAEDVHRRIDQSTRRFLGFSVEWLGCLPFEETIPDAARQGTPFVLAGARRPAVVALEQLASRLVQEEPGRLGENRAA
jgi:flagellar biosynthesis protein FlhG